MWVGLVWGGVMWGDVVCVVWGDVRWWCDVVCWGGVWGGVVCWGGVGAVITGVVWGDSPARHLSPQ